MHGFSLRHIIADHFRTVTALAVATASAGMASAQAPVLNATRMHKGRVINEVHFQFVPDHYVNFAGDGVLYGAQIFSVSPMTNNVPSETAAIGERYSDRRLTGAWSGSYGNFRFTRRPDAAPPFNQAAGILLTPPKGTNQLRVVARDLHDYNAAFPHTRITLFANGVFQGAQTITTPSGSGVPLVYSLTIHDTFSVRLTGAGTATVQSAYLYGSSPSSPISWAISPNVTVTGNGSTQWFSMDFYGGPASDMALRVNASGVNSQSRLVVANQAGKIILEAPLVNGQNVVTTEDANPLRRVADVKRSYPPGVIPPASESRVIWGDDMKLVGPNWTKLSSAGSLWSNGSTVILQGPVSAGTLAARIQLPATYYYDSHRYLSVRVRASENCRYFIRPYIGGAEGHTKSAMTALEARPGKNSATDAGWETVTFNMKTLADLYSTPARGMDSIDLIISTQPGNPAASMRLEFDYMALSTAIPPDILRPSEEVFTDGLDDDGDGYVDRDDPDFRAKFPVSVYVNYQTVVRKLGVVGFSGTRKPAPGQSGPTIQIDATQFTPTNPTKRTIATTYYPLDYVKNPSYEPPGNYNEYWDRNQSGNWSPCGSAYAPPTQQFPSLNYQTLGAIEEYDVGDPDWMYHQARLARNHGLDGFIYNDFGYASGEPYIDGMKEVLNKQAAGAWKSKPFQLAPFYSTLGDPNSTVQTASSALKDLIYAMKMRGMQCLSSVTFQGKPVIFIYPTSAGSGIGSTLDLNEWAQIFEGLLRPDAENFDGAFNAPLADPAAENILTFKFNRWRTDTGTPWSGSLDRIEWLDENLIKVGETEVGTPDQRPALIDGWWPLDTETEPGKGYTEMISAETPGQARLRTTIPPNAAFLRVVMRAWGKGPEVGGQQQVCELRLNTMGTAGVSFDAKAGWNTYLFRLRNLPAGFTTAGKPIQTLPELPVSLWGMMPELVATLDQGFHRKSGFDGLADYNSLFKDARVEVNYPYLRAATVRPGFDAGGISYSCNGLNNYFTPYNGGAIYRSEWEQALKTGADMVIITSWNEFPEGTNIEPDIERGFNPLRLTLTYSLLAKGTVQTGKMPSQTNLLFRRFDIEGDQRTIDFSLTGPDTIRIGNTGFGYAASKIVSIQRNGTPVSLGSAEAKWEGPVERPTLVINAPAGSHRYVIVYNHAPEVQRIRHSTFAPVNGNPPAEWQSLGSTNPGLTALTYDPVNTALRAHVSKAENVLRVTGYYTASSNEWLPYAAMGPYHYARAKFYIYAGGQSDPSALNQIPNLRLRVANRFSVTSMLEVFHHSNGDPGNAAVAAELRPSTDPERPSIYRVDMDPIDIPYLQSHAGTEGLMRGFEVFSQASDFQDNGYLALTESTIGIYPASLLPDSQAPIKHYKPADLSLAGGVLDIQNVILQPNGLPPLVANDPPSQKGTHTHGAHGVTLDTSNVPTNRVGYVSRDFNPGNDPTAPDYVRVEENKIYKVSFHLTSTRPVTANAQIRMRVRAAKFAWVQKLEIGGSWATGSEAGATIAQQSLPGPGSGNPSGWYSVLFHSPMNIDIRADGVGALPVRMPNLCAQPGPGDPGGSVRDLKVGLDLLDTLSAGTRRDEERGNVTCDQIMIRVYPQVPD